MNGSIVNFFAIIAGSLLGLCLRMGIPEESKKSILSAMGLVVLYIGTKMSLESQNALVLVVSLALGTAIGEFLKLEEALDKIGIYLTNSIGSRFGDVGRGFITASLVYTVGAMAIVGSIQEGLTGDASIIYTKSLIDGIVSIVFSASMGIGVMLSAFPVLIYQGGMTLTAHSLEALVTKAMLTEISAVGGILIVAIALNMLGITKIRLASLLPSIIIAALLVKFDCF